MSIEDLTESSSEGSKTDATKAVEVSTLVSSDAKCVIWRGPISLPEAEITRAEVEDMMYVVSWK